MLPRAAALHVTVEPVEDSTATSKGLNRSGVRIMLTDGEQTWEVSRVAYARRNSKNPEVPFEDQLDAELGKAYEASEAINAALDEADRAAQAAIDATRDKVSQILGEKTGAVPA